MTQLLKNKKGTTLVELVVCMVLLSLFTVAAVTLIQPSAKAFQQIQNQTRAQNLADALIESIRGELIGANGYIRFADAAEGEDTKDSIFTVGTDADNPYGSGTALEFSVYPNHIEVLDAGYVPALSKAKKSADGSTTTLEPLTGAQSRGYLHLRYYVNEESGKTDTQGNALFGSARHKLGDADIAAAYTTAYAEGAYMGMHISDLHFYARWDKDSSGVVRVTSMTVTITVADADNNPLCSQKAIVPLPGQPRLLYEPGTWDGSSSF